MMVEMVENFLIAKLGKAARVVEGKCSLKSFKDFKNTSFWIFRDLTNPKCLFFGLDKKPGDALILDYEERIFTNSNGDFIVPEVYLDFFEGARLLRIGTLIQVWRPESEYRIRSYEVTIKENW